MKVGSYGGWNPRSRDCQVETVFADTELDVEKVLEDISNCLAAKRRVHHRLQDWENQGANASLKSTKIKNN